MSILHPAATLDGTRKVSASDFRAMRLLLQRSHRLSPEALQTELQRLDQAWQDGRLAFSANANPRYFWALCAARGMLGDFTDWHGWTQRSGWSARVWRANPFRFPLWDGSPTERLLLIGEQGIGDEVLWASCIPDVLRICGAQSVSVEVDERLVSVFQRSFGVAARPVTWAGTGGNAVRQFDFDRADATAWLPLADLFPMFRREAAAFPGNPYLVPDPVRVAEFECFRGFIGVSWRGNNGSHPWRTFDGQRVISLQYDQRPGEDIPAPGIDLKNDLEGVIALISVLDRVVSVSTAVAHFAGALGVGTDVVLAPAESTGIPDDRLNWRWGLGSNVPWYRSARVFQNLGEWWQSEVAQRVWNPD